MEHMHIADVSPELPTSEGKQLKAVVTLIWPYSSSTRQFGLLLAEPDLRLRRNKGQVRVRFSGSSAKAIATAGVGIGDHVVLGLRGAHFMREDNARTPGKSIDWSLSYHDAVTLQVFRNGCEIANLNLVHASPTPPPLLSPMRQPTAAVPSPAQQWSSPAFLKRARLSDPPVFDTPLDPFADDLDVGRDKKRRRKSYRDWKAWTYSARTPSPAQEDVTVDDQLDALEASPSRRTQLPKTVPSPPTTEREAHVDAPENSHRAKEVDEESLEQEKPTFGFNNDYTTQVQDLSNMKDLLGKDDDFVHNAGHDGPDVQFDGSLSFNARYAFGGDTEVDTEEEDDLQGGPEKLNLSATEVDTKRPEDDGSKPTEDAGLQAPSISYERDGLERDAMSAIQKGSLTMTVEDREVTSILPHTRATSHTLPRVEVRGGTAPLEDALRIAMPPPLLTFDTSGVQTPIGTEPSSPTLKPLDSSTLPLPSPFPGEQDFNETSYLDHITSVEDGRREHTDVEIEEDTANEADYIMETSFYSSIGSSKTGTFHPTHESAFTPVRFTFGMDGAGFSRPREPSPLPEPKPETEPARLDDPSAPSASCTHSSVSPEVESLLFGPRVSEPAHVFSDLSHEHDRVEQDLEVVTKVDVNLGQGYVMENDASLGIDVEVIQGFPNPKNIDELVGTQPSTVIPEIVDLGSPSEDGSDGGDILPKFQHDDANQREFKDEDARPTTTTRDYPTPVQHPDPIHHTVETASMSDQSESAATGHAHEDSLSIVSNPKHITYTSPSQASDHESYSPVDDWEPQLGMDDSNILMQNITPFLEAPTTHIPESSLEELFPDIKMESIENDFLFEMSQQDTQPSQDDQDPDKLLIAVPREGDKVGKMEFISVPATAPARNTRSKAKTSTSPFKEEIPVSKRSTRSSGSKVSLTSNIRTTISPPKMRGRSTMSQSQDVPQLSPLHSRSWSKLRSPTKNKSMSAATSATAIRSSPRKPALPRNASFFSDLASSQYYPDTFATSFEPSQELGDSQGRFSNVLYVKDSEQDSSRSEHSISTVQGSDDWNEAIMHVPTDFNDPTDKENWGPELLTPPRRKPRMFISSSPTQTSAVPPRVDGLGRNLHLASSADATPSIHAHSREIQTRADQVSSDPSAQTDRYHDRTLSKRSVQDIVSGEVEDKAGRLQVASSPPVDIDEFVRRSLPIATSDLPSSKQQPVVRSNSLTTPETMQQTSVSSQFNRRSQQATSLTLPPTQAVSADLTYSEAMGESPPTLEPALTGTAPHQGTTDVETVSSPSLHSADNSNSDDEDTLVAHSEQPSIGLSTPLAYYTPLKDLVYFLNRSSQFHSSANPDILALVISASTVPTRAAKGPQHWTNTLHVTDRSSWPAITTVQVFRAHQTALPVAEKGDVVLLRAFGVKSLNRSTTLVSAEESSWCVWRYQKPVWGAKKGAFAELRAREEVRGPVVERGEGEWKEAERLRGWYVNRVKKEEEEDKKNLD